MLIRPRNRLSCLRPRYSQSLVLRHRRRRVEHYSSAAAQAKADASNNAFFAGNASLLPSTHPLGHLRSQLTSRPYAITIDVPTHIPTKLLHKTLSDFLPKHYHDVLSQKRASTSSVPPGYHLIHFPPSDPLSALQSDGTDPAHSPGPPFNRRMWAGGFMHFYRDIPFDCRTRECVEKIANVEVRGKEGEEKVFVLLKRLMLDERSMPMIVEGKTLVFMRDQPRDVPARKQRIIKPPAEPAYSHTLTPTAGLLFRFSALTFNAHRIHLDKDYCRDLEGHRNLLVHGPLSLVLMLDMLQGYLGSSSDRIVRVEYKNLAPLYAEEPMSVCGKEKGPGEYEVWIEGAEGGLAVKGTVQTEPCIPGTYQSLQDQLQKLTAHPMPIHSFAQRTDSNPIASEDDDAPTLRGFNSSKERQENGNDASLCAGQLDIATAGFQDHWLPAVACPMENISVKDVLAAAEGFLLQAPQALGTPIPTLELMQEREVPRTGG